VNILAICFDGVRVLAEEMQAAPSSLSPSLVASLIAGIVATLAIPACWPRTSSPPAPVPTAPATPDRVAPPELIARALLFGNPERSLAKLSPDGKRISFLAPVDGVLNLWVGPVSDVNAARPITRDRDSGVRRYRWARDNQHLLLLRDDRGDEKWHVHAVDATTGQSRDLTPFAGISARIVHTSPRRPHEVAVTFNRRDPRWPDLHRVDLRTGDVTQMVENTKRFQTFHVADDLETVVASRARPDGGREVFARDERGRWRLWQTWTADDDMTTAIAGFGASARDLYLLDSRGRDTAAFARTNLVTGESHVLYEDPKTDVQRVLSNLDTRAILAVQTRFARVRWTAIDPAVRPDLEFLASARQGDLGIEHLSHDANTWLVTYRRPDAPVRYYVYQRPARTLVKLFSTWPALEQAPLVPMRDYVVRAADGLELVTYVSLPAESDPDGDGVPTEPLPAVLWVHGGPWTRDDYEYRARHQWLANRGYAVLSVNFRGSTGFGKRFLNAGNRQWGKRMQSDLADAVAWAARAGVIDSDRVAIVGASFGGYAALAGLAFSPRRYACGVDAFGPSNLETLLASIPPHWEARKPTFYARIGDPRSESGTAELRSQSPLFSAANIERPLLIVHGARDPRVKESESEAIVTEMTGRGLPVTYVRFPDEGHGFRREANERAFYGLVENFLASCLGGRAEPLGSVDDSSLEVRTGRDLIPGL